ncbi:MAG: hypothetical protein L6427_11315 [Actinomycetia bacterium]|nr:hypothetical protein [Actinomycetes bacterium]
MEKKYKSLDSLIKSNRDNKEDAKDQALIDDLAVVKQEGEFNKEQFLRMGMWKSPRAKNLYLQNEEVDIVEISKKVFDTEYEKRRIELLTRLKGVAIPTASAILMLTDPEKYGVIDIRVWQVLYDFGSVRVNPTGTNFSFKNWYNYLMKLRAIARKYGIKARDVERIIFKHHQIGHEGQNLYQ